MRCAIAPSSANAAINQIADVMRRASDAGALQFVPELSWILFLRILDEREEIEAEQATALGIRFSSSLQAPFWWRDWAVPGGAKRTVPGSRHRRKRLATADPDPDYSVLTSSSS